MIEFCKRTGRQIIYSSVSDSLIAKFTVDAHGRKEGVYYEIDRITGQERKMMEFSAGLPHGEMTLRYPDGMLHIQGQWVRGRRHGDWYSFQEGLMPNYTIYVYSHDVLAQYYYYNYLQELLDYEQYSHPSMSALAKEIDEAFFSSF